MRIGIDFDNTIASYDQAFAAAAEAAGLVAQGAATTKKQVRKLVRAGDGGECDWMRLQGQVYGAHMRDAELIDGVGDFLERCREHGHEVLIISHKTEFGHFDEARVNLRDAAYDWMAAQGFFDEMSYGLDPATVFFEPTRTEKVGRIKSTGCTHFIDDLVEVFEEPGFPTETTRILYAADAVETAARPYAAFRSWHEIADEILGDGN
jgi:hypothetical protein